MAGILTKAKERYIAGRGFHTDRRLIVIESDDWGSIRMPSAETFRALQRRGDHPENDAFLSNDCLESDRDLQALTEVLTAVRDSRGNPAVMTANFAMANPDFEKIDLQGGRYAYEPFTETYERYYPGRDVLSHVRRAGELGCFVPQLHCREHLNVGRWMHDLMRKKRDTVTAFEHRMIGIGASFSENNRFGYMDAFNTDYTDDETLRTIVGDAADLFETIFGRRSRTFVASCFVWNDALEAALAARGVTGIQSGGWQNKPVFSASLPADPAEDRPSAFRRRLHYTGQKNAQGQRYCVRNCCYEPAYCHNAAESAEQCYRQIVRSFQDRKPAIINSHRFNYIGSINPQNARENLAGLRALLTRVVLEIPAVEFIATPDLIDIMEQEKS